MSNCNNDLFTEVSLEYPLYQSQKGNYFIGQTPILSGQTQKAMAALVNPINSNRTIYLNAMTITNISNANLSAEFYLKSTFNNGLTSNLVSCTNTAISPQAIPKGQVKYLESATVAPNDGVSIFSRIVSPFSTLVVDGGQIILAPGQSIIIYIGGFIPVNFDSIRFALGWWEERIENHCSGCY